MCKVTIIIPVYNAEQNIKTCLNSIINQEFNDYEVICINDGSKDKSESIIKKFIKKNKKFKLINKENSGVSDTRNIGIEKAKGKYVLFVDADDYISKDYLSDLTNIAEQNSADIVISAYTEVQNNKERKKTIFEKNKTNTFNITFPKENINYFSTYEFNPCWKQLIKKSLLIEENIRFNKNIKYGEDMLFSFECYVKSKKTIYEKNYGYYYYINNESVMSKRDPEALNKFFLDNIATTEEILKLYNPTENEIQALYFKTLKVYCSISWKMISSYIKYHTWKKNIIEMKKKYNKIFESYKLNKYGTIKENLYIFLLKYNILFLYYLIRK